MGNEKPPNLGAGGGKREEVMIVKKVNLEKLILGKTEIPAVIKKKLLGGAIVENGEVSASNNGVEA